MYTIDENSDEPIMMLDKHIGYDAEDGQGIDGALFASELLRLDTMGKSLIKVCINSPGGTVVDGMAIYSAILRSKTKVDTYCTGMACSIAAVIFQAGRKRYIADYGFLMYHMPFGGDDKGLEVMAESISTMISRTGMKKEDVDAMMQAETFVNATEAIKLGLADEIEYSSDLNKKRLPAIQNNQKGYWREANKILNKIFNKESMSLLKITNKLKLNADASEESIVAAIVDIQDKLTLADAQNKKSKDELDKMKNDMDEAEDKFKKMQDAYNAAKKELDDTKDAAMTEKCKNMVEGFAKIGRIKNDKKTIDKWVVLAKADFEETKNMIEELPLNKDAVHVDSEEAAKAPIYNMALAMTTIRNKAK